jgi:hypothetical protein
MPPTSEPPGNPNGTATTRITGTISGFIAIPAAAIKAMNTKSRAVYLDGAKWESLLVWACAVHISSA